MFVRKVFGGVLVAVACGGVAASCGSDDPAPPGPSAGGTRGDGGIPDGSSGASGRGGSGATGGAAGTGGSGATGGAGATSGTGGSGAVSGTGGTSGDGGTGATGGSSGTSDGGGTGGTGGVDAGPDTGPDVAPCPGCDGGPCTSSGTCVECTRDEHCSGAEPRCNTASNECVQCLPADDKCPNGSYCTDQNTCAKGCKNGASCASGVCSPARDCVRCVSSDECSGTKLCGSGVCAEPCSTGDAGDAGSQCGTGLSCCEPRCVDVARDVGHCGACGTTCANDEFCGTTGCFDALFPNVCKLSLATALMDIQSQDVAAAQIALTGLTTHCAPAPTTRSVDQETAEAINPATGRVVQSGGELLMLVGGPFLNSGARFMETTRQAPVYNSGVFPAVGFYRSADLTPIVTGQFDGQGRHDFFVIQLGREQTTGTLTLLIYGFHANGTRAATWYFANRMLPDLATYPGKYYVLEWTDGNNDGLPDNGDTFAIRGSG